MSIQTIAIVHHVHTNFGYTVHPCRTKREHIKYINQAADYILASSDYPEGSRFAWTQEQLYPIREWWKAAMNWIPENLWNRCNIRSAMQIDVNGMHTEGMVCAHERGVHNLWIGPISYYGAPPMPTPTAFNWQIAPDEQMFVWLNSSYNIGFFMFNENWRQGSPEAGDIWASDEASIRKVFQLCLQNIALFEGTADDTATSSTDGFTKNRVFGGMPLVPSQFPLPANGAWTMTRHSFLWLILYVNGMKWDLCHVWSCASLPKLRIRFVWKWEMRSHLFR